MPTFFIQFTREPILYFLDTNYRILMLNRAVMKSPNFSKSVTEEDYITLCARAATYGDENVLRELIKHYSSKLEKLEKSVFFLKLIELSLQQKHSIQPK